MSEALPPRRNRLQRKRQLNCPTSPREFVVVGGGIAGVCCAQELARLNEGSKVTIISSTDMIKEVLV